MSTARPSGRAGSPRFLIPLLVALVCLAWTSPAWGQGRPLVNDALPPPPVDPRQAQLLAGQPHMPYGASAADTSEFLMGKIAYEIIFTESDGTVDPSTEDWSDPRIAQCVAEVGTGMDLWVASAPASTRLQIVGRAWQKVNTQYEPINHSSGDSGLWYTDCLAKLGYSGDWWTMARDRCNYLRDTYNSDWAFLIFIADDLNNPSNAFSDGYFGFAWLGGPIFQMTYDNDGWGIGNMDIVTMHEAGHIFYALDEYGSSDPNATSGYLNVVNGNAEQGGIINVPCIMRASSATPCYYTEGQVGWWDSDDDGNPDILDVAPTFTLDVPPPDSSGNNYPQYQGTAHVNTISNRNPYGLQHNITIDTVDAVQYREGSANPWVGAQDPFGTLGKGSLAYAVRSGPFSAGNHSLELRGLDTSGNPSDAPNPGDSFTIVPPAPATSVSAVDHYDDFGGAIDLAWTKSADDGGGVNDVTEYQILRSTSPTGPFSQIGSVASGTQTYADNTATTGTDFYYVVRTSDGIDSADSAVVGPVASADDKRPAAVTNLAVADVPGDQGLALNLAWTKSADDGGGYNWVTGYRVLRSDTPTGPFMLVASLLAGSESYGDTGLGPGTTYYYKVAAMRGVYDKEAGPVSATALDNLPPAPATGVSAGDAPADTGSAIDLVWTKSADDGAGAADVIGYDILRSTSATGGFALTGSVGAGSQSYRDSTVTIAQAYYYKVRAKDTANSADSGVAGPASGYYNVEQNVAAVTVMLGAPVQPPAGTDIAQLLGLAPGAFQFARWKPTGVSAGSYLRYPADAANLDLTPALGRGFWLRSTQPVTIRPYGVPANDTQSFRINLAPGWNQIANPFTVSVEWGNLLVKAAGEDDALAGPLSSRPELVRDYAWRYSSGSLRPVHAALTDHTLAAWDAVWLKALQPCTIIVPAPGGPSSVMSASSLNPAARTALTGEGGWRVPLTARVGSLADDFNFFGVSQSPNAGGGAWLLESPPMISPYIELSFAPEGGQVQPAAGNGLAVDLRPGLSGTVTWRFVVATDVPASQVTIEWPDMKTAPLTYDFFLVDQETRQQVYMRSNEFYTYFSGPEGGARAFLIEARPHQGGGLLATLEGITPSRGGVAITYRVTQTAALEVEIINLVGLPVRRLVSGLVAPPGVGSLVWDGATDSGSLVPPGYYLCRVIARTAVGEQATAIRGFLLGR